MTVATNPLQNRVASKIVRAGLDTPPAEKAGLDQVTVHNFQEILTSLSVLGVSSQRVRSEGPAGGQGGNAFQDIVPTQDFEVGELRIWGGNFIDAVQIVWRHRFTGAAMISEKHGGPGGTLSEPLGMVLTLQPGEFIIRITGRSGNFVDSLQVQTNFELYNRRGGQGGANDYVFDRQPGEEIIGFHGKSGNFVDALGVLIRQRP